MSIGLVCDFALFKHAPLACMRWICLCMAKRFTHERPSALTLPTDDPAWLIQFEFTGKLTHSIQSTLYHTLAKSWGFCPFMLIYYTLVLLLLLLLAVHPWLLGINHLYIYTLLKKVSTLLIDASLDTGYMFISILLLLWWWYSPLEVQLWWRGCYSIFIHWRLIVLCWLNSRRYDACWSVPDLVIPGPRKLPVQIIVTSSVIPLRNL